MKVEKDAKRMVKRVVRHTERAGKTPSKFLQWLEEELQADHEDVWVDEFSSIVDESNARALVHSVFNEIRNDLLDVAGQVTAQSLPEALQQVTTGYLEELPARLAADVIELFEKG